MKFAHRRHELLYRMTHAKYGSHHDHKCVGELEGTACWRALHNLTREPPERSIRVDRPDLYAALCGNAREMLGKYANKPARKRRGDPRRKYRHMGGNENCGGVISRRSWKLAINAFAIVGEHYADFEMWASLRSTCKKLHARLRIYVAGIKYMTRVDFIPRDMKTVCMHRTAHICICHRCAQTARAGNMRKKLQNNHIIQKRIGNKYCLHSPDVYEHAIGKLRLFAALLIQRRWRTWRLIKSVRRESEVG